MEETKVLAKHQIIQIKCGKAKGIDNGIDDVVPLGLTAKAVCMQVSEKI